MASYNRTKESVILYLINKYPDNVYIYMPFKIIKNASDFSLCLLTAKLDVILDNCEFIIVTDDKFYIEFIVHIDHKCERVKSWSDIAHIAYLSKNSLFETKPTYDEFVINSYESYYKDRDRQNNKNSHIFELQYVKEFLDCCKVYIESNICLLFCMIPIVINVEKPSCINKFSVFFNTKWVVDYLNVYYVSFKNQQFLVSRKDYDDCFVLINTGELVDIISIDNEIKLCKCKFKHHQFKTSSNIIKFSELKSLGKQNNT